MNYKEALEAIDIRFAEGRWIVWGNVLEKNATLSDAVKCYKNNFQQLIQDYDEYEEECEFLSRKIY